MSKIETETNILLHLAWLVSATNIIALVLGLWSSIVAYYSSGLIALSITILYVIGALALSTFLSGKSRFLTTTFSLSLPVLIYWSFKGGSSAYSVATLIFIVGGVILWGVYSYLEEKSVGYLRR